MKANIVAISLENQQQNGAQGRQRQVRECRLVVEPYPQTRGKLAHSVAVVVSRDTSTPAHAHAYAYASFPLDAIRAIIGRVRGGEAGGLP